MKNIAIFKLFSFSIFTCLINFHAFTQTNDTLLLSRIENYDGNNTMTNLENWNYNNLGKPILYTSISFVYGDTIRKNFYYDSLDRILAEYHYSSKMKNIDSTKYIYHSKGETRIYYNKWDLGGDYVTMSVMLKELNETGFCYLTNTKEESNNPYDQSSEFVDSNFLLNNGTLVLTKTYDILGGPDLSSRETFYSGKKLLPGTLISSNEIVRNSIGNMIRQSNQDYISNKISSREYIYDTNNRIIMELRIVGKDTNITHHSYFQEDSLISEKQWTNLNDGYLIYKYPVNGNNFDFIELTSYDSKNVPLSKDVREYSKGYLIRTKSYYYSNEVPINCPDQKISDFNGKTDYYYINLKK